MSDKTVFMKSFEESSTDFEFENKQWIYQVDNSNGGSYSTGQVNFDLGNTFTDWTNFREGVITIPLVMSLSGGASSITTNVANAFAMSLKNGYHQLIHSYSIQLNGITYKEITHFENMDINYRILSQFSKDDEQNLGSSIGFTKDTNGFTYGVADSANYGLGETNNVITQVADTPTNGYKTEAFDASNPLVNQGRIDRMKNSSFDVNATNYAKLLKNQTQINFEQKNYCVDSANTAEIVYYILATIPVRLMCPLFDSLPLTRGMKVSIQLQTNTNCVVKMANIGSTTVGYSSATYSVTSQGSVPFMVSPCFLTNGKYGLSTITTADTVYSAGIGIAKGLTTVGLVGTYAHPQPTCRFYAPIYKISPNYEEMILSKAPVKKIVYNDIHNAQFLNIPASGSFQYNMPFMTAKARYLLICPYLCSLNNGASPPSGLTGGKVIGSPVNSPFSSAGGTCTPYLQLSNFNVQLSGSSIYQVARNFTWEAFQNETRQNSLNGGLTSGISNGLISEDDFNNNGYNFVYVDLSRHSVASDAVQKQISITATNNNLVPIDLYCFVGYEKEFDLSVSNGQIVSV